MLHLQRITTQLNFLMDIISDYEHFSTLYHDNEEMNIQQGTEDITQN